MSAFIVDFDLIDALVTFAFAGHNSVYCQPSGPKLDHEAYGQALVDANYKSVNYRYRESEETPRYTFMKFSGELHLIQVIKAAQCLRYQSCEPDDFEDSTAARMLDGIIARAISTLPGYDKAEWGMPANPVRRRAA